MKARLWKISLPVVFLFLFMFVLIPLAAKAQPPEGTRPENIITAEPVHGVTVGPGKKLWVFVFPAKGGNGGGRKPPKDEQPSCLVQCDDGGDLNDRFAKLGFTIPEGLDFYINENSIPNDNPEEFKDAILNSFYTWGNAGNVPLIPPSSSGTANMPAADGENTIGWVRIAPRNTLAATWVWTQNGIVQDVDIFYNLFHKWGISDCGDDRFDVQNVGTHEVGHVIGLGHVSDDCKTATMYPSAPKGEVKKRTLTNGDIAGVNDLYPPSN